jgi:NAD(P)-dependent dehydrogenase (short-subunit alcohol dehydrogenase family)
LKSLKLRVYSDTNSFKIFSNLNYNYMGDFMDQQKAIRTYSDAVAIVTGGASGIGRALSEELVKRGCEVVIADRQIEVAEELAARLRKAGGKATAKEIDVTKSEAIEELVRSTFERTGRLDYIFNNAGIGIGGGVIDHCIEDWNYIIDVNLKGVINGIQAAYKIMADQGFGHIVNTASMAGLIPSPGSVAYSTTKHAVVGLSKSLRAESAHMGIRVSVLCPGVIRTPILQGGVFGRIVVKPSAELVQALDRMWEKLKPMQPDILAEKVLNAVAKNKAIIIEPSWWKLIWKINRFFPILGIKLSQGRFEKTLGLFKNLNK